MYAIRDVKDGMYIQIDVELKKKKKKKIDKKKGEEEVSGILSTPPFRIGSH